MLKTPNDYEVAHAIAVLNEALSQDPRALRDLLAHREVCNQRLAQNDTVQVRQTPDGVRSVGVLGLINGILGARANGMGPLAVEMDDNGDLLRFTTTKDLPDA